jgi:hypothetical protein
VRRLEDVALQDELAVLGELDEQNAVGQFLGGADGRVEGGPVARLEQAHQHGPALVAEVVKLAADRLLFLGRLLQESRSVARELGNPRGGCRRETRRRIAKCLGSSSKTRCIWLRTRSR